MKVIEMSGPSPNWAHSAFDPVTGQPFIVYGPAFHRLPPLVQRFTQAHECCHLSGPLPDEYDANCCAIKELHLSPSAVKQIAEFTAKSAPILPPQYGGSGAEFWRITLERCGDASGKHAPDESDHSLRKRRSDGGDGATYSECLDKCTTAGNGCDDNVAKKDCEQECKLRSSDAGRERCEDLCERDKERREKQCDRAFETCLNSCDSKRHR